MQLSVSAWCKPVSWSFVLCFKKSLCIVNNMTIGEINEKRHHWEVARPCSTLQGCISLAILHEEDAGCLVVDEAGLLGEGTHWPSW